MSRAGDSFVCLKLWASCKLEGWICWKAERFYYAALFAAAKRRSKSRWLRSVSSPKGTGFNSRSYCASPAHWEAARPDQLTDPQQAAQVEGPKAILVVDDDELTVKLLQKVLEAWEAKVEVAQNGKEALSKLAAESFDLLVCDIRMPEMTGQELFQHIQENGYLPPQRILFLTGEKSAAVKQFLDGSGCYLYKPLQFLDFPGQVQALLAGGAMP